METELQHCLPGPMRVEGNPENTVLYEFSDGCLVADLDLGEQYAFDHLAAADMSSANDTPMADYIVAVSDAADVDIELGLYHAEENGFENGDQEPQAEIRIGDAGFPVKTNAGIFYASALENARIEVEERVLEEDFGRYEDILSQFPPKERWYSPGTGDIQVSSQELEIAEFSENLDFIGFEQGYNQKAGHLINKIEFEGGVSHVFGSETDNIVFHQQLNRERSSDIREGSYSDELPAAMISAYPAEDLELDDISFLDVFSLPAVVIAESDCDVKAYMKGSGNSKDTFLEIDGETVSIPDQAFASLYPVLLDEVNMKENDVRDSKLGVSGKNTENRIFG